MHQRVRSNDSTEKYVGKRSRNAQHPDYLITDVLRAKSYEDPHSKINIGGFSPGIRECNRQNMATNPPS